MKMMRFGINIKQRDIVLIPFPYSDLSAAKKRPVLIISNSNFHKNNDDVICCAITSSKKQLHRGILIDNLDMEEGNLEVKSVVKQGKIFAIDRKRIIKILGTLNISKTKAVTENLNFEIKIDE